MLNLEEQIVKQIKEAKNILLTLPSQKTGGSVSAGLAFYLLLKKLNKKVDIVSDYEGKFELNKQWSFLPAYSEIKNDLKNLRQFIISLNINKSKVKQIKYTIEKEKLNFIISPEKGWFESKDVTSYPGGFKYDLIICLDAIDLESLGNIYDNNIEFFYKTTIINIDRHPGNEEFGQINYIDLNVTASTEILYYLFKNHYQSLIDEDIATCLLAGIISDSKNFKVNNLSPRTLLTTSQLIDKGARREEIITHLYRSRSFSALKLWGKLLNNLKSEENKKLVWSKLSPEDFKNTGASEKELIEIIDELILNLNDTYLLVIIYQIKNDSDKYVILESIKNINALKISSFWQAKGNSKRAIIKINKDSNINVNEIIEKLKLELAKISQ
jgi:bifunctional oligoribonuclease and PAP phosphatase NrnA